MAESAIPMAQSRAKRPAEGPRPADRPINVSDHERWLSLLGGGVLALYCLRRSLGHLVLLCGAGALLARALTGHCALYQAMGLSTVSPDLRPDRPSGVTGPNEPPLIVLASS